MTTHGSNTSPISKARKGLRELADDIAYIVTYRNGKEIYGRLRGQGIWNSVVFIIRIWNLIACSYAITCSTTYCIEAVLCDLA